MAEPKFTMTADDDLPRTLRREKEAREREAREREAFDQPSAPIGQAGANYGYADEPYEPDVVSVRYLQIPFFHLMLFFLKAVIAAIPALILFTGLCILIGKGLQYVVPELRVFDIQINFPPKS
jgi:hypothetical protein